MILLDSYAVIALLTAEAAAPAVAELLRRRGAAALTVLGVSEVLDYLIRLAGAVEDEAVLDLAQLGLLPPVAVHAELAVQAGLLRARRYHRSTCAVSLADCIAVEAAREQSASVATSDPHLLDVCHGERVKVIPLPDRAGRIWQPKRTPRR